MHCALLPTFTVHTSSFVVQTLPQAVMGQRICDALPYRMQTLKPLEFRRVIT
jgi:hypothetical protein